ncbi:MAG TPA: nucleoside hydrolase, partial [Chloroflexota bacterium]|nr:nucleoside hydrolase [Chloroflexota bacterium]
MPIDLLLDTDIGDDVDDVFALLLAARHPDVGLRAVTTVFGQVDERARLARHVLELAGRRDVPVAVGARETLDGRDPTGGGGATMASAPGLVGPAGSEAWERLGAALDPRPAADLLIELIRGASGPIVLAAIGPLTNVAAAFRRAPDLAQKLDRLVLMGGRVGEGAERGEHNFNCDPDATRVVLESGASLRIGTWEVTAQARLTAEHVTRLRAGDAACRSAATQLETYLAHRRRDWTSMYDPLSMTLAYTDRYLETRPMRLSLETAERKTVLTEDPRGGIKADVSVGLDAAG